MSPFSRLSFAGLIAMAAGATPAFATVIFTDSTFNLGDYAASPTFTTDATASLTYVQCPSCGTSGSGLEFTAVFDEAGSKTVAVGLANTTFAFDPSTEGEISSIDVSVDKNISVDFAFAGLANNLRVLILQDSVYYVATIAGPPFNGPGGPGYITFAPTGLVETSFFSFDFTTGTTGAAHPDFGGNPMLFGLMQLSSTIPAIPAPATVVTQYDDLSFAIHAIPEPATIVLLGASLLGLGWLGRRRSNP